MPWHTISKDNPDYDVNDLAWGWFTVLIRTHIRTLVVVKDP